MSARAASILFAVAVVLAALAAARLLRGGDTAPERGPASGGIVSLSPSVTETLFALGSGYLSHLFDVTNLGRHTNEFSGKRWQEFNLNGLTHRQFYVRL